MATVQAFKNSAGVITAIPTADSHQFATIGLGVAPSSTDRLTVQAAAATDKGVVVRGAASQSANLLELQNSALTVQFSIGPTGNVVITDGSISITKSSTNADGSSAPVNAISIATANGTYTVLGVDVSATDQRVSTGITNSGSVLAVRGDAFANTASLVGTLTNQFGLQGRVGILTATSGAVVSNAYGLHGSVLNRFAGTTIVNAYACFLDNSETTGTVTNRYDLYASAANAKNFFAGVLRANLGFGIGKDPVASPALDIVGSAAPALSAAGSGRIYFDSTTNKFRVSENGGAYVDLV